MPKLLKNYLLAVLLIGFIPAASAVEDYRSGNTMRNATYPAPRPSVAPRITDPNHVPSEKYGTTVSMKFGSGISNLTLGFLEMPKNIVNTINEGNLALGLTGGVMKGLLHSLGRTLSGFYEVLTFPIPTEPVTTPQFVWQTPSLETTYNPLFELKK